MNPPQQKYEIPMEIIEKIINDKSTRKELVRESHYWFFHLYFSEYVKYATANFQREIFRITEDDSIGMAVVIAFRGSAKSTIMTMSYPLWAILGKQQKKCVVIISQTQQQVRTHFSNLKRELENNEILRKDIGALEEESDEWGSFSLVLKKYNARIIAASSEQSIRGIRHGAYRPDLIICDDVEDLTSVKTKEGRDKTYSWLSGEVIPLGDKTTKIIMIGNFLHEDSLLMRLKKKIQEGNLNAVFHEFPLVTDDGEILWKEKFQSMDEIEQFRKAIGDEKTWQREYMLKIIPEDDQLVYREWISYYESLPPKIDDYRYTVIGVDLAISTASSADFTSMVTAHIFGNAENLKVYIEPNPFNKRVEFPTTIETLKTMGNQIYYGRKPEIHIEDVGYQKSVIQQLKTQGLHAKGFQVQGQDKRSRLNSVTPMIRLSQVLFPIKGCEDLIQQLVYFGVEKHDDLVDAFTIALLVAISKDRPPVQVITDPELAYLLRGGSYSSYRNESYKSFI